METNTVDCGICFADKVVGICENCECKLCVTCFKNHTRAKMFSTHIIFPIEEDNNFEASISTDTGLKSSVDTDIHKQKCKDHIDENQSFYCEKHDVCICGRCVISNHTSCLDLVVDFNNIPHDAENLNKSVSLLQELDEEIDRIMAKIDENRRVNDKCRSSSAKEIHEFHVALVEQLKILMTKAEKESDDLHKQNTDILDETELKCKEHKLVLRQQIEYLDELEHKKHYRHLYLALKRNGKNIELLKDKNARYRHESNITEYEFVRNLKLLEIISEDQHMGTFTMACDGSDEVIEHVDEYACVDQAITWDRESGPFGPPRDRRVDNRDIQLDKDEMRSRTERVAPSTAAPREEGGGGTWRRGGGGGATEEQKSEPVENKSWQPAGATSWRDQEKEKHDSWKKDPADAQDDGPNVSGPPPASDRFRGDRKEDRGEGGAWRPQGTPSRGERGSPGRGEIGPPSRDERGPSGREKRGPPGRNSWRDMEAGQAASPPCDRRFDNRDIQMDKDEMSSRTERVAPSTAAPREDGGGGTWRRGGGGGATEEPKSEPAENQPWRPAGATSWRDRPQEEGGGGTWRRGGGGSATEEPKSEPAENQPWRPAGGTNWRDREKEKHDSWKKDPETQIDVDKELEKVDEEDNNKKHQTFVGNKEVISLEDRVDPTGLTEAVKLVKAAREKDKGNEEALAEIIKAKEEKKKKGRRMQTEDNAVDEYAVTEADEEIDNKTELEPAVQHVKRPVFYMTDYPLDCVNLKEEATILFKSGQYGDAAKMYGKMIDILTKAPDQQVNLSLMYSNRAACHLKTWDLRAIVADCNASLGIIPHMVKPLVRRAIAYERLKRYKLAYIDYRHVMLLDSRVEQAHLGTKRCQENLSKKEGPYWRANVQLPKVNPTEIPIIIGLDGKSTF